MSTTSTCWPRLSRDGASGRGPPARSQGRPEIRVRMPAATPCRSAPSRPCATSPGPTACRATTSIRRPSSTARPRPALAGPGHRRSWRNLPRETLPEGLGFEWTELAYQQIRRRQHGDLRLRARRWCSCSWCSPPSTKAGRCRWPSSWSCRCACCASIAGVLCAGMDNNIFTQIGFVVLIGLAAKNAILIVEFAKQLEDQGATAEAAAGGGAAAAAADPDDFAGVHPRRRAAGVGGGARRAAPDAGQRQCLAGMYRRDGVWAIFMPCSTSICRLAPARVRVGQRFRHRQCRRRAE